MLVTPNGAQPAQGLAAPVAHLGDVVLTVAIPAGKASLNCHCCNGPTKKFGRFQNKNRTVQRYRCHRCGKTFSASQPLEGLRLDDAKTAQIVHLLCEGVGIRAARLAGVNKNTVLNVLCVAGENCASLLTARLQNLKPTHVEIDEIWTFVLHRARGNDQIYGDQFCWLSIDQPTRLILNYQISKRTKNAADCFLDSLKRRIAPDAVFDISSDGLHHYRHPTGSVFRTFGHRVNYGTEIKTYGHPNANGEEEKITRYRPMVCTACERKSEIGERLENPITVNHLERQNLSLRLFNRRFTRLTLGYSRKIANLEHAVALFVAFNNFCRVHSSIKQTPAQAAGLADHKWTIEELLSATI